MRTRPVDFPAVWEGPVFDCGHPATPENSAPGRRRPRCRACHNWHNRERQKADRKFVVDVHRRWRQAA